MLLLSAFITERIQIALTSSIQTSATGVHDSQARWFTEDQARVSRVSKGIVLNGGSGIKRARSRQYRVHNVNV